MTCSNRELDAMRYADGEMTENERLDFETHLAVCPDCSRVVRTLTGLKEVTETMTLADVTDAIWDTYWTKVYNRLERSIAWFLFIVGVCVLSAYAAFEIITNPGINTIVGLGLLFLFSGSVMLFGSVLREKLTVNKDDRYISEVKR